MPRPSHGQCGRSSVGRVWYPPLKRTADILLSATLLIALSALMLGVAVLVKATSPGPALYRHKRCGRYGRRFNILKFRSMRVDADRVGAAVTASGDPRVTPIGRFLRKSKLDELPQLWNVLMADMSLVGPRPQVAFFVKQHYPDAERRAILSVRPGITGKTQIWCRHEEEMLAAQTDPDTFYKYELLPQKVASDVEYVHGIGPKTDARILFGTVGACLNLRAEDAPVADGRPELRVVS